MVFPYLDFDVVLGKVAKLVSWTTLPVVRAVYRAYGLGD
jgi:hypothetical protein